MSTEETVIETKNIGEKVSEELVDQGVIEEDEKETVQKSVTIQESYEETINNNSVLSAYTSKIKSGLVSIFSSVFKPHTSDPPLVSSETVEDVVPMDDDVLRLIVDPEWMDTELYLDFESSGTQLSHLVNVKNVESPLELKNKTITVFKQESNEYSLLVPAQLSRSTQALFKIHKCAALLRRKNMKRINPSVTQTENVFTLTEFSGGLAVLFSIGLLGYYIQDLDVFLDTSTFHLLGFAVICFSVILSILFSIAVYPFVLNKLFQSIGFLTSPSATGSMFMRK